MATESAIAATANEGAQISWRLPFNTYSRETDGALCSGCLECLPTTRGMCMQGNHGADTHHGELAFAFDFALHVGTPVLAAADGVVAASVGNFKSGGRQSKEMRTRANYVAIRHGVGLYTRYYHLCHGGAIARVGEHVHAGQVIGRSGNTGFSGAPHLHWDVVDVLPTDTATLTLLSWPVHNGSEAPSRASDPSTAEDAACAREEIECVAAAFSSALPGDTLLLGEAVWADPPDANASALRNAPEQLKGHVVLVQRCKNIDFLDKARRVEEAGALAVVVINFADAGASIFTMGMKKAEASRTIGIPAVMVSHRDGTKLSDAIRAAAEGLPPRRTPQLAVGRSPHFVPRCQRLSPPAPSLPTPADLSQSDFVPRTLPARFLWPGHLEGYLPTSGMRPPKEVQVCSTRPANDPSTLMNTSPRNAIGRVPLPSAMHRPRLVRDEHAELPTAVPAPASSISSSSRA